MSYKERAQVKALSYPDHEVRPWPCTRIHLVMVERLAGIPGPHPRTLSTGHYIHMGEGQSHSIYSQTVKKCYKVYIIHCYFYRYF